MALNAIDVRKIHVVNLVAREPVSRFQVEQRQYQHWTDDDNRPP
jgi:hypothetical protein